MRNLLLSTLKIPPVEEEEEEPSRSGWCAELLK
jgi:hypothetical protein